jgi:UDP:flavonoid glycosyltransferase YjiC (YdhE family)
MLHYAPNGTTSEMLLAGKPGLLLPADLEKGLVARRAQQQGAAIVDPGKDEAVLGQQLERLVEDLSLRSAAEAFAARYRHQDRAAIMPGIAARFAQRL